METNRNQGPGNEEPRRREENESPVISTCPVQAKYPRPQQAPMDPFIEANVSAIDAHQQWALGVG